MIGFYKSLPSTWPLSGWCYFDHLTIFFAQDTGPLPISRNVFPINFSRIRVKKLWLCDQRDRRRIHLACSREAECSLEWIKYPTRQPVKHSTFPGCFTAHLNYVHWISFLKKRWNYLYKIRVDRGFYKLWKELPITIIFFFWSFIIAWPSCITGGQSSSCEMIILQNKIHGEIIWVCMEIFTTAQRNKKYTQILNKKYLTLLPQCIACFLTAYYVEKNPFWRVIHFLST